jgi:hypothetical protein
VTGGGEEGSAQADDLIGIEFQDTDCTANRTAEIFGIAVNRSAKISSPAVGTPTESGTHHDVLESLAIQAARLTRIGVRTGTVVALLAFNGAEWVLVGGVRVPGRGRRTDQHLGDKYGAATDWDAVAAMSG